MRISPQLSLGAEADEMANDRQQLPDTESANEGGAVDAALLVELTRALLPYLGPYSITTVKRAARGKIGRAHV